MLIFLASCFVVNVSVSRADEWFWFGIYKTCGLKKTKELHIVAPICHLVKFWILDYSYCIYLGRLSLLRE